MRFSMIVPLAGMLSLVCLPGVALASHMPGAADLIRRADAVLAAQSQNGTVLAPSDPRVKALVAAAKERPVFGDEPLTADDLGEVSDMTTKVGMIVAAYMLEGVKGVTLEDGAQSLNHLSKAELAQVTKRMLDNNRKYQDVLLPLFAFSFPCVGHSVVTVTAFLSSLPENERASRMPAVRQVRFFAAKMYSGLFEMTPADPQQSAAYHADMVRAAAAAAPEVVSALTLAERKDLYRKAQRAGASSAAAERPAFEALKHALADTACVDLCAYGD